MIFILAFCIPILFLFLYIVFFSFEIAATLQVCSPSFFGTGFSVTPIWELTNVFLIFALVSVMAFFPNAISSWAPEIAVPAFVFLVIQAIRVGAMMIVFYGKKSSIAARKILLMASILSPAVLLGTTLPTFLIGTSAFSPEGFGLGVLITVLTAAAVSITAVLFLESRAKKPSSQEMFFIWILVFVVLWIGCTAWAFPGTQSINTIIANPSTVKILLYVCMFGILVSVPGVALLYSFFL